jgi:hypothetical protein
MEELIGAPYVIAVAIAICCHVTGASAQKAGRLHLLRAAESTWDGQKTRLPGADADLVAAHNGCCTI